MYVRSNFQLVFHSRRDWMTSVFASVRTERLNHGISLIITKQISAEWKSSKKKATYRAAVHPEVQCKFRFCPGLRLNNYDDTRQQPTLSGCNEPSAQLKKKLLRKTSCSIIFGKHTQTFARKEVACSLFSALKNIVRVHAWK